MACPKLRDLRRYLYFVWLRRVSGEPEYGHSSSRSQFVRYHFQKLQKNSIVRTLNTLKNVFVNCKVLFGIHFENEGLRSVKHCT